LVYGLEAASQRFHQVREEISFLRGFQSFFHHSVSWEDRMAGTLLQVPLDKCVADDAFNTRHRGTGDLTSLKASIAAIGIKEPLLGKAKENNGGEVEIYAGYRRLAAAKELELATIPVLVVKRRAITRQMMLIENMSENLQRADLNPVDEALALQRLQADHSMSVEDICAKLGLKKNRIQQRFRLLKLRDVVRDAVHDDKISIAAALEIDRLPADKQVKFLNIAEELHGQKLKDMVDKELEKLQKKLEGVTRKKKDKKPAAASTENSKLIKKAASVLCEGLKYDTEEKSKVGAVNFKALDDDDLQVVAKFFDDLADQVEDEVAFNDKAQEEIVKYVETGGDEFKQMFDTESPAFRSSLVRVISERAAEIARDEAGVSGKRAKVTYAVARKALDDFFCPYERDEGPSSDIPSNTSEVQA
jgi:ParB family chromosome partitioning protein